MDMGVSGSLGHYQKQAGQPLSILSNDRQDSLQPGFENVSPS